MPKYRNLNLKTFITAIDPLLVEEYFVNRVPPELLIPYLATTGMNYSYVKNLMASLKDEQRKGKIGEELRQMSDLGKKAMDILVRVSSANNILLDKDETPQQLAMRLFLKHSKSFEHAWTLYCYDKSVTNLYEHYLPCNAISTNREHGNIEAFASQIRDFFINQAKGDHCVVKEFEEQSETTLMIIHGSYIKTVARWVADEVVIDTYRPAYEDVILYDKTRSVLKIKASRKDRQQYFKSFAECILTIPDPVQSDENNVYSLRPIENKTFSWMRIPVKSATCPVKSATLCKGLWEWRRDGNSLAQFSIISNCLLSLVFRCAAGSGAHGIAFKLYPVGVVQ